jgi:hypothetical protein
VNPPPKSSGHGLPDIICFFTGVTEPGTEPGPSTLILLIEIKPPHKLTSKDLKRGFCSMDLQSDIIDVNKIPTEIGAKLYWSKQKVAAIVTQIFSYMVEGGVEYGIVVTGEALAFLHVKLDNPGVVYYHLAVPNSDVASKIILGENHLHRIALTRVPAFTPPVL